MGLKSVLAFLFILFAAAILTVYWFFPMGSLDFGVDYGTSNFSVGGTNNSMQFYQNMRFPDSEISYRIEDCPIGEEDEFARALNVLEENTVLSFYPVASNEEVYATCDERTEISGGLIVAGEGGPTEITITKNFNVISKGKLILHKNSNCENPNVALHEMLHVLGFDHSENPDNIMYNVSSCGQEMGDDIINTINELYSYPSLADLSFENMSAQMNGRYLDTIIGVRNNGLVKSEEGKIIISADGKNVKELELDPLGVGEGVRITLENVWTGKVSVNEISYEIIYSGEELEKTNNKISLSAKG